MDPTERRPWSDLRPEILSMIARRLDARMDVLRLRSVCPSFRSSIPWVPSRFPFRIPFPQTPAVFLRASAVYAFETPEGAASGRARWLLRLEESELGHMRILSLFSQRRIAYLPRKFPKKLDSLQFRVVEICRGYSLDHGGSTGGLLRGIQKVVMHPDSVWSDLNRCLVYFITEDGQLGYCQYGDEKWCHLVDQQGSGYDDIVVYDGKVCVVDQLGLVWQIDSSFRLRSFSPPISSDVYPYRHGSYWKHLVVLRGDLYVVDRYIRHGANERDLLYAENMRTCGFRVYRLDRQCGMWEEVISLGNSAFFLCKLCSFAISGRELSGCVGNCIYYAEKSHSYISSEDVNVFSLADRSIKRLGFSDFLLGKTSV